MSRAARERWGAVDRDPGGLTMLSPDSHGSMPPEKPGWMGSRRDLLAAGLLAALPTPLRAAEATGLPGARPAEVGLSEERLDRIREHLATCVREGRIAGTVGLIARDGKAVLLHAVGWADVEAKRPMKPDTLFWIASMTKSLTATTIMTLVDEGKLALDEPASRCLPECGRVRLAGRPPAREITLRDLLSHTSGLAQPPRKPTDGSMPLERYTLDLLRQPLNFEPGSAYEYGFGLTVAGRIAEIAAGKPFDVLMDERVLRPLGMDRTTWHPGEAERRRLAKTYRAGDRPGSLIPALNPFVTPDVTIRRPVEPSGGLFSTAADMARFYQMILNGGELAGRRILSRRAVEEMTRPHTAGGKELAYGLGWQILRPAASGAAKSLEGFGHGGAFATHGAVDRGRRIVAVLMVQRTLSPADDLLSGFHRLAAEAVESA